MAPWEDRYNCRRDKRYVSECKQKQAVYCFVFLLIHIITLQEYFGSLTLKMAFETFPWSVFSSLDLPVRVQDLTPLPRPASNPSPWHGLRLGLRQQTLPLMEDCPRGAPILPAQTDRLQDVLLQDVLFILVQISMNIRRGRGKGNSECM